eukprot:4337636-Amphidinium_carterae.2
MARSCNVDATWFSNGSHIGLSPWKAVPSKYVALLRYLAQGFFPCCKQTPLMKQRQQAKH